MAPPMICSVRWSSTVSSVFIGVHRRQKIPCFLRTNTLPRTRQVHRFDHLNRWQVDGGAIRRACFGCGQWAALRSLRLCDLCVNASLRATSTNPPGGSDALLPPTNLSCGWLCRINAETAEIAERAEKARPWRFAHSARPRFFTFVRSRPPTGSVSHRSLVPRKSCND